ncbi:hypothetical protein [Kitasatospora sp. GP82]|uniref:hypothetical protein n=1 Tax=Kitasatospora sp. GP82 TaxID=3035089 RepID=UPI0024741E5A|nr:hypothetical protein [Kitasatospora sp. GP82]MDH6126563.1 hypothetical protein [Kitasatospora sp. GP82]
MEPHTEIRGRLEQANDNAAAFWLAQAQVHGWEHLRRPGWTAVRCARDATDDHRVVITRRYPDPVALTAEISALFRTWGTTHFCLEDPYGKLDLADLADLAGEPSLIMPVMTREPDAVSDRGSPAGLGFWRILCQVGALGPRGREGRLRVVKPF